MKMAFPWSFQNGNTPALGLDHELKIAVKKLLHERLNVKAANSTYYVYLIVKKKWCSLKITFKVGYF